MSKGEGLKIGIKFTDDLVGDIRGNESAFTITGQEYKYVNGPLIDGNYLVDKVERYPVQRVWELGGELQLDGPGEMAITDSKCYETTGGTTLTGTVNANAGDIVLATISHRSEFATPSEWDKLYESIGISSSGVTQKMVFAIKKIDAMGEVSFTATQSSRGRMYLNLISISGLTKIELAEEYEAYSTNVITSINVPNKVEGEKLIWGCSAPAWLSSGGLWSTSPNDLDIVSLPSNVAARQANFIDKGNGNAINRSFTTYSSGTPLVVAALRLIQEYTAPKIYTPQPIMLNGEHKLNWLEEKPVGTGILIEYATGQTQGQWQEINNGDSITSNTNLWIRATLSTEDTAITPILEDLWLEEPNEPQDKILITMDWWGRFNNVEGDLTVKYDASKGRLSGIGGVVENFTETFTPTDLVPKPNPGVAETIISIPSINIAFTKVTYNNRHASDYVVAKNPSITVAFTNVGIVNP